MITSLLSRFSLALLLVALLAGGARAQTETEAQTGDPQAALSQLIEVLRDDAAREGLIAELEAALEAEGDATEAQETEPEPTAEPEGMQIPSQELRSIGRQIADFTREATEEVAQSLTQLWRQLANAPRIFAGLQTGDPAALAGMVGPLALLVGVTYGGFVLLWVLAARPRARLHKSFTQGGWVAKPVALLLELALDVATVFVPYAAGYTIAVSFLGTPGEIALEHTLYLNAFVMVEVAIAVLRTVLSPLDASQRLVQVSDGAARATMGWARVLIGLFVFGQLMVLPLVNATVSYPAGRAVSVLLVLVTLLVAAAAVIVVRRPVRNKLLRLLAPGQARRGLRGPIAYWHVFALLYIGGLAVAALTRTSTQFQAILWSHVLVAIAILAGFIALNVIRRVLANGIMLPEETRKRAPELQRQLNGIAPAVLKVARAIVILAVAIYCLDELGLIDFAAFTESAFGARVAGSAVTVMVILGVAIIAWIGLNAWVDTQINPELAPKATARRRTLLVLMRNALTIAIVAVTLMVILSEIGINIAPLLASAGVIGLAIGFGAQKLVQDIITGIFIQLEGAIDVGDVVSIGGISGVVERLTIRSASLRDAEGSYHVIPFSSVDTVTNFMRGFSYAIIDTKVAYKQDAEAVKQAMADAFAELKADPKLGRAVLGEFEWMGVESLNPGEAVFRGRIKTRPGQQWGVKRAYFGVVKRVFVERNIEVPSTVQNFYFNVPAPGPEKKKPAPERKAPARRRKSAAGTEDTVPVEEQLPDPGDAPGADKS